MSCCLAVQRAAACLRLTDCVVILRGSWGRYSFWIHSQSPKIKNVNPHHLILNSVLCETCRSDCRAARSGTPCARR